MQRRRKRKEPIALGSVFGEFLENNGFAKRYLYDRALIVWEEAAGREISSCTRALRVENGNLFITVKNSLMRQEIYFMKSALIDSVNKKLGRNVITDLILR